MWVDDDTYLLQILTSLTWDLMNLKICSIGFNHGEYSQLNSTETFKACIVCCTMGCLWITALSINTTITRPWYLGSFFMFKSVWWMKLSNNEASTPPSINCMPTTSSIVIAANIDTENSWRLHLYLVFMTSWVMHPYLPSFSVNLLFAILVMSSSAVFYSSSNLAYRLLAIFIPVTAHGWSSTIVCYASCGVDSFICKKSSTIGVIPVCG